VKLELVLDEVDLPWSPDPEWRRRLGELVASTSAEDVVLQVVLTDDETLRQHNRDYRGIDRATDVLSFSYLERHEGLGESLLPAGADLDDYLDPPDFEGEERMGGQILVSVETVATRGPVHTTSLDREMAFMLVHGMLHVLGFDHADDDEAASMRAQEERLMAGLSWPLVRTEDPT
jgi:probable rRNA maturation factor